MIDSNLMCALFPLCRTGGEHVTRLLLTSSNMENTQDINENDGDDEIGLKLPAAGSARTAWQALQLYLVRCCRDNLVERLLKFLSSV